MGFENLSIFFCVIQFWRFVEFDEFHLAANLCFRLPYKALEPLTGSFHYVVFCIPDMPFLIPFPDMLSWYAFLICFSDLLSWISYGYVASCSSSSSDEFIINWVLTNRSHCRNVWFQLQCPPYWTLPTMLDMVSSVGSVCCNHIVVCHQWALSTDSNHVLDETAIDCILCWRYRQENCGKKNVLDFDWFI